MRSQDNASAALVRPTPPHMRGRAGTHLWARARGKQGGLDPGPRGHSPGMRSGRRRGPETWSAPGTTKPGPPGLGAAPLAESVSWEHRSHCQSPTGRDNSYLVLFSDFTISNLQVQQFRDIHPGTAMTLQEPSPRLRPLQSPIIPSKKHHLSLPYILTTFFT